MNLRRHPTVYYIRQSLASLRPISSMASLLKKVYQFLSPEAEKEEDGRDKWPSRAAFVLAAMVGFSPSVFSSDSY